MDRNWVGEGDDCLRFLMRRRPAACGGGKRRENSARALRFQNIGFDELLLRLPVFSAALVYPAFGFEMVLERACYEHSSRD